MAEKGDDAMKTAPELEKVASLYANDAEKIKFLEKAEKKNFMVAINAKTVIENMALAATGKPLITADTVLNDRITKMKADALAEVGYDGGWAESKFTGSVQKKIETLQISQPPTPGSPATPSSPPVMPKPGGGERFKEELLKSATDARSLAFISQLKIP